jgi:hypothetical protein
MHGDEPSIPSANRIARFFQWTPFEYGVVLLYEGYRGRKSSKRKNARRVKHEAEVAQDNHRAA